MPLCISGIIKHWASRNVEVKILSQSAVEQAISNPDFQTFLVQHALTPP